MPATPASQLLAAQHQTIDTGVKAAATGGDTAALAASLALLRLHLYIEEALLFPPLAESGLTMPVFVMKREHGQMWPLLEALSASGVAADVVAKDAKQLFQLLQMHNPKEESIVYTALDRLEAKRDDASLAQAISTATAPAGWRCAMAPH
ncbi:MAG TPA: hemerythrin domain-containing protein [Rhodanobacteraceae bacterium]